VSTDLVGGQRALSNRFGLLPDEILLGVEESGDVIHGVLHLQHMDVRQTALNTDPVETCFTS
jgi:hypothetical protein